MREGRKPGGFPPPYFSYLYSLYTSVMYARMSLEKIVYGLAGIAVIIVAWQAVRPKTDPPAEIETVTEEPCKGDSIVVNYPFGGAIASPHECKVQCIEGGIRYILYSNGSATQCETPPGCNDWGEDHNVTCIPPAPVTKAS